MSLMPFASIGREKKGDGPWKPRLFVDFPTTSSREDKRTYPATKAGARRAGKEIYEAGFESWQNSSSVDFPEEYDAPDLDFRELMTEGAVAAAKKTQKPRGEIVVKMFQCCDEHLLPKLGPKQREVYERLKVDSLEGE